MPFAANQHTAIHVFLSHVHKDKKLREDLETQLRILQRAGHIDAVKNCNTSPGSDWRKEIDTSLQEADIILFLISPEFLVSEIYDHIEKQALAKHEAGLAICLAVYLRPAAIWEDALPIGKLKIVPGDGHGIKPITKWKNRDEAFARVVEEIRDVVVTLKTPPEDTSFDPAATPEAFLLDDAPDGDEDTQRLWAERTVQAVNRVFPEVEFAVWPRCQQHFPQALVCAALIKQYNIETPEAAHLLNKAGRYAYEQAHEQAQSLYEQALTIRMHIRGSEHIETAQTLNDLGELLRSRGRQEDYDQAQQYYEKALTIRKRTYGMEHEETAETLNNLGELFHTLGDYKQAEHYHRQALEIRQRVLGMNDEDTAMSMSDLGGCYEEQGKFDVAEEYYQKALAVRTRGLGPNHYETAKSYATLGPFYRTQGKYAQARQYYEQAIAIYTRVLGPEHPKVLANTHNLAVLYRYLGQYKQAKRLHLKTIDIWKRTLGKQHPDLAAGLAHLGKLYSCQQDYARAAPLYKRALEIRKVAYSVDTDHPGIAQILNFQGEDHLDQGHYAEAEMCFDKALAIYEKKRGPEHPDTADVLYNQARLCVAQGQNDQAKPLYERALAIYVDKLGEQHPETIKVQESYRAFLRDSD